MYNFADYASTIDYYAIIDGVVLVAALAVLIMLFAYRRNIRILIVVLSVAVLEVLVMVLSSLSDHEVLTVSRYILHYAMLALIVMCCVVYQSDLKAIFQRISNPRGLPMFNDGMNSDDELRETTAEILSACQDMAKQDVGAIIIIDSNNSINDTVLGSGTMLNAELSAALLESIFNTKAPLHDGAVIVRGNKVVAAGCFLPLTQRNINKEMGTRHRAAIGITEDTDVLSIVVSEETGIISVVKRGELRRYMTMDKLKDEIEEAKTLIKRYEEQQRNVRNNREFDSLSKEIEYQALEIELREKRLKEYAAEIKVKTAQAQEAESKMKDRQMDLEAKRSELQSIEQETADEVETTERDSKIGIFSETAKFSSCPPFAYARTCTPACHIIRLLSDALHSRLSAAGQAPPGYPRP